MGRGYRRGPLEGARGGDAGEVAMLLVLARYASLLGEACIQVHDILGDRARQGVRRPDKC